MNLRNYQEDLVLYVAELVLQDLPDLNKDESFLHDIAAYTLNRLPPRYIRSERGFTRLAADHWVDGANGEGLAGLVEVLLLVHKAIETIQHRRKPEAAEEGDQAPPSEQDLPDPLGYWHNLPCVIGRVLDADTREPVQGVAVSTFLEGKSAVPAEASWKNPYRTTGATKGFFSFLPRAEQSRSRNRRHDLQVVFEHPEYETATVEKTLFTEGEYTRRQVILSDSILNLESTLLKRK